MSRKCNTGRLRNGPFPFGGAAPNLKLQMNLYYAAMKKYLLRIWTTALLAAAVAISCTSDPEVDRVGRVGFAQESLTADGTGEELTLHVTSNAYWHIEFTDPETGETIRWVSASETSGMGDAEVTLNVSRNRSTGSRSTYVNVITDSESDSASILLTQGAGSIGGGDGYGFPVTEMFQIDMNHALNNAFIEGSAVYFDDGMILRRTGGEINLTFEIPSHTNPKTDYWFQRGVNAASWSDGDAWVLEIPVKDELSGDLRYTYGSRRDNAQSASSPWVFEWSADGVSWTAFDGTCVGGASDAVWKTIDFTIPEAGKIPAGGKLWIRHTVTRGAGVGSATNKSMTFQHGICITRAEADQTTLPEMDSEKVAFAWGFDDVTTAKAAYIDLPIGFMSSWNAGSYSLPRELADLVDVKECYTRPGFLQLGRGDEAVVTRYTQGAYTIKLAQRFEAMRISKSDLKLTFLASAMVDAYGNATEPGVVVRASGATVDNDGRVEGVANNAFKPFTVYVRGATPETEITITSADKTASTDDVRFFLDDILLEIEGEPQRPSADDPVKAAVADIRAKKGAAAVTIADNLFIQARVTSVDNVPAGCFAVQDADAGLFVHLPGHGFAAGDLVEVVVKDARLETDADGLLVVTPVAADRVTRVQGEPELPAARAISVADLKAGAYEAMLVSLPESQVVDADLAKRLAGSVTLEGEDRATTFVMKTYAEASFASAAVPQKRGVVKGLAGASFLLPTSAADLAAMTGTRFGETVYAIKPISGLIKVSREGATYGFRNVTYADNTVTYSSPEGCTITKVGNESVAGCKLANTGSATIYDGRFLTTGWGGDNWQENGLVFKIKATSRLVGNLRFGFGLFANNQPVPKNYKIVWSNDNATWNDNAYVLTTPFTGEGTKVFSIPTTANAGGYKMAYFNVPESKAVAEGGFIYVKIMQADNTTALYPAKGISTSGQLLFQHGFYLSTHEKGAYYTTNLPSGTNVLLTEGFDDAFCGHDYFIPSWQMWTNLPNAYTMPEGWEQAGSVYEGPGYIRVGKNDADDASSITTPALIALGDATANVTLKFKVGIGLGGKNEYKPDPFTITFKTSGSGSVGTMTPDLTTVLPQAILETITNETAAVYENAYHRWYEVSVPISGATKDTRITIGGTGRHFFDEIVITRD